MLYKFTEEGGDYDNNHVIALKLEVDVVTGGNMRGKITCVPVYLYDLLSCVVSHATNILYSCSCMYLIM